MSMYVDKKRPSGIAANPPRRDNGRPTIGPETSTATGQLCCLCSTYVFGTNTPTTFPVAKAGSVYEGAIRAKEEKPTIR